MKRVPPASADDDVVLQGEATWLPHGIDAVARALVAAAAGGERLISPDATPATVPFKQRNGPEIPVAKTRSDPSQRLRTCVSSDGDTQALAARGEPPHEQEEARRRSLR